MEGAAVAGVDEPLAALEDALATGLAEASHDDDGWTVGFRHTVLGIAARDTLGPASLAALHERAAEVVGSPAALAHRAAVATGPEPALVAALTARAARAAEDVRAGRTAQGADRLLTATRLSAPGPGHARRLTRPGGWSLPELISIRPAGPTTDQLVR